MASPFPALLCALVALAFWTAVGLPVARHALPRSMALPFAPLAGWALHSVVALPLMRMLPFTASSIAAVAVLSLAASWLLVRADAHPVVPDAGEQAAVSPWAWAGAALLAIAVAIAILPKPVGDAVRLSPQVFDHAKVAMVDDMARLGVPAGNPFFADDGGPGRLSYYYLLHFSAAELARLTGASGWEADVAMTFFAAFTSLAAMMALAVRFGGRAAASVWVVVIAATSSARVVLLAALGAPRVDAWLPPSGSGGWLFQSSWVPQHLVSTSCVLLAVLLMVGLAQRRRVTATVALAAGVAAGFESSTWVGGVVFACVAAVVVPLLVWRCDAARRVGFVVALVLAALGALALAWPFVADQLATSALRGAAFPVALHRVAVLGADLPRTLHALFDAAAYWLVLLPVALPAAYLLGVAGVFHALWRRAGDAASIQAFAATTVTALAVSWLLASTIAVNNDLGWRALLLASTTLIAFAAAALASWIAARRRLPVGCAFVALALGVPEGWLQVERNVTGSPRADGQVFAATPELWRAVRAHAGERERVASNPLALQKMTSWPVNIGWSLLADRRSCYAGWELAQVFTAVPHDRLERIDAQFTRVFAGAASPGDARALARDYACDVAVVTPQDGAWARDAFGDSADWSLVDERPGRWRIYRRRDPAPG